MWLHLAKLDFGCLSEVMMLGGIYHCGDEISYECDRLIGCQSFFFFWFFTFYVGWTEMKYFETS